MNAKNVREYMTCYVTPFSRQFLSTKFDNELFACLIVEYQESDNQKQIFHSALKAAKSPCRQCVKVTEERDKRSAAIAGIQHTNVT